MYKVLILYIIAIVITATDVFSQVSGISNSKVVLPATATVKAGDFEFEPSFNVFWYNQVWDRNGNTSDNSYTIRQSSLAYRFTAGFNHNIEAGLSVPEDISSLGFGLKWMFWNSNGKSFALQSGLNIESDTRVIFETDETQKVLANGIIFTYEPNSKFSIDTDASYSLYSTKIYFTLENSHIPSKIKINYSGTFDIGIGYFLSKQFQAIVELNSAWISFENASVNSSKTNGTLGIKYTPNDSVAIIFGLKQDLFGVNNSKGMNFTGAFTFLMG